MLYCVQASNEEEARVREREGLAIGITGEKAITQEGLQSA